MLKADRSAEFAALGVNYDERAELFEEACR
jgi:hypothetical protein